MPAKRAPAKALPAKRAPAKRAPAQRAEQPASKKAKPDVEIVVKEEVVHYIKVEEDPKVTPGGNPKCTPITSVSNRYTPHAPEATTPAPTGKTPSGRDILPAPGAPEDDPGDNSRVDHKKSACPWLYHLVIVLLIAALIVALDRLFGWYIFHETRYSWASKEKREIVTYKYDIIGYLLVTLLFL